MVGMNPFASYRSLHFGLRYRKEFDDPRFQTIPENHNDSTRDCTQFIYNGIRNITSRFGRIIYKYFLNPTVDLTFWLKELGRFSFKWTCVRLCREKDRHAKTNHINISIRRSLPVAEYSTFSPQYIPNFNLWDSNYRKSLEILYILFTCLKYNRELKQQHEGENKLFIANAVTKGKILE